MDIKKCDCCGRTINTGRDSRESAGFTLVNEIVDGYEHLVHKDLCEKCDEKHTILREKLDELFFKYRGNVVVERKSIINSGNRESRRV